MIAMTRGEDLRLSLQSSECPRVNQATSVSLKRKPMRIFLLGVLAPEAAFIRSGIWIEKGIGLADAVFEGFHRSTILCI